MNLLPVLMYHDIREDEFFKPNSISLNRLNLQLEYLCNNNYNTISIKQLLDHLYKGIPLPLKPVLITFDDGYKSIATYLYPLLQKHGMKATSFLVPCFVHESNNTINSYLSINEIKNMNGQWIEWGIHSFDHKNFKKLAPNLVREDLENCMGWFKIYNIPFVSALAYPFGAYPKHNLFKRFRFFKALSNAGVLLSFRIGNRMNFLNRKAPCMLQRIEITGNETLSQFSKCLKEGKKKSLKHYLKSSRIS